MLHLLYMLAFTVIAFIAISNMIRNLITISTESQRRYASPDSALAKARGFSSSRSTPSHPELLDDDGHPINEPLLVMRSVSVEDARERLDAIYNASPNPTKEEES